MGYMENKKNQMSNNVKAWFISEY